MPKAKGKMVKNTQKKITVKAPVVSPEPTTVDSINKLNKDFLVRIFRYLPMNERCTIETVCKSWKEVAKLVWNDTKVLNFNKNSSRDNDLSKIPSTFHTTQCLGNILKRCGNHLEDLELGPPCDSRILPLVLQHCTNLTKLRIETNYHEDSAKLLSKLQGLKYGEMKKMIDVEFVEISHWLSEKFFQQLRCENLIEFHIWVGEESAEISLHFPAVLEKLKKLTAFTLKCFILGSHMLSTISRMSNLKYLSLAKCKIGIDLTDFKLLKHLEHLNIEGINVDDNFLLQLSKNNKKLKYLNLSDNNKIRDAGLMHLVKLPLEELILNRVFGVTDESLGHMLKLRRLECEDCNHVFDDGIVDLIAAARNLEYLNLAGCEISEKVLVDASGFAKLRKNNLKLLVVVSYRVRRFWSESTEHSPLLTVEVRDHEKEPPWRQAQYEAYCKDHDVGGETSEEDSD